MVEPLSPAELARLAGDLPEWQVAEAALTREFIAPSFAAAVDLVVDIAEIAEALDHHPDIDIRFRRVMVFLTTYSVGHRVTDLDVQLAQAIDAAAVTRGAS